MVMHSVQLSDGCGEYTIDVSVNQTAHMTHASLRRVLIHGIEQLVDQFEPDLIDWWLGQRKSVDCP